MRCDRKKPCLGCQKSGLVCSYSGAQSEATTVSEASKTRADGIDEDNPEALEASMDDGQQSDSSLEQYPSLLLGTDYHPTATTNLHPSTAQIWALYHVYEENVDPLIKLIHLRSFHQGLLAAVEDLWTVQVETEALLFAIYFAAIVSLSNDDCKEKFKDSKSLLLKRYRHGLEQCLLKARFLQEPSMPMLQAFVLFIFAARHAPLSAPVPSLLAVAVQLAMKLNIHQRPTATPINTFTTIAKKTDEEMCRRIWWTILALDVQIAEDSNSEPTIWENMWSCRMPSNLDDVELDAFSNLPLPPRPGEVFDPENQYVEDSDEIESFLATYDRRTDMFYALLRIEMSYAMRQFAFSEHFCRANKYKYLPTASDRMSFLDRHMESINHRYLRSATRNDAFSFFVRNAVKLILSRHVMVAKSFDEPMHVLHNAIMVLEAAASMRRTHRKWAWSLRSYVELDALELLWRSLGALSPAIMILETPAENATIKHAYMLGDVAFQRGEEDECDRCYGNKWIRIKQLRVEAHAQKGSAASEWDLWP